MTTVRVKTESGKYITFEIHFGTVFFLPPPLEPMFEAPENKSFWDKVRKFFS